MSNVDLLNTLLGIAGLLAGVVALVKPNARR